MSSLLRLRKEEIQGQSSPLSCVYLVTGFNTLTKQINHLLQEIQSTAVGSGRALMKIRYKDVFFFSTQIGLESWTLSLWRGEVLAEASGFISILETRNQRGTEDSRGTRSHYASQMYFIYLPFIRADLRAHRLLKCLIDSLFPGGKNTEIKQNIFELPHPENKVH